MLAANLYPNLEAKKIALERNAVQVTLKIEAMRRELEENKKRWGEE